jgi:hypothetical protein
MGQLDMESRMKAICVGGDHLPELRMSEPSLNSSQTLPKPPRIEVEFGIQLD